MAVVVYHSAAGHLIRGEQIAALARDRPRPTRGITTTDDAARFNDQQAREHARCTRAEVLDLLTRNGAQMAAMLRSLSDEQLQRVICRDGDGVYTSAATPRCSSLSCTSYIGGTSCMTSRMRPLESKAGMSPVAEQLKLNRTTVRTFIKVSSAADLGRPIGPGPRRLGPQSIYWLLLGRKRQMYGWGQIRPAPQRVLLAS